MKQLKIEQKDLYWNNKGKYSKEFDQLWKELVPSDGEAESKKGELVRCLGRLHYEYYNNGNCNAAVEVYLPEYNEDEYDLEVSDFYQNFIDYIKSCIPSASDLLKEIERVICMLGTSYDDGAYDRLIDHCMPHIIAMSKEIKK